MGSHRHDPGKAAVALGERRQISVASPQSIAPMSASPSRTQTPQRGTGRGIGIRTAAGSDMISGGVGLRRWNVLNEPRNEADDSERDVA